MRVQACARVSTDRGLPCMSECAGQDSSFRLQAFCSLLPLQRRPSCFLFWGHRAQNISIRPPVPCAEALLKSKEKSKQTVEHAAEDFWTADAASYRDASSELRVSVKVNGEGFVTLPDVIKKAIQSNHKRQLSDYQEHLAMLEDSSKLAVSCSRWSTAVVQLQQPVILVHR